LEVSAKSFLTNGGALKQRARSARVLQDEVSQAMEEALGCGGLVSSEDLLRLELQLTPLWRTLPKNTEGNVERRSLRYALHRYFTSRSAVHIRGFELSRSTNESGWGSDDILGSRVPAFVEAVLEAKHTQLKGFTLGDAAYMVATIEQLIFDWEGSLLETVYSDQGVSLDYSLGFYGMVRILTAYVIQWLLRVDADTTAAYLADQTLLEQSVPSWPQVSSFIRGRVKALEVKRRSDPARVLREGSARQGHNALVSKFSFEDAHRMIGETRRSFASFWDSECSSMKEQLFDMDTHHTGRVPLSKFYGTGIDADWRFAESEDYLRQLGVLDETSSRGKQVIIPNYIQGASNCVVSTPHYLVCCSSDCEVLLSELEEAVAAPTASPERLLEVVGGLISQSSLDDDAPTLLTRSLRHQLRQIADTNQGEVPLHGRLFGQWLHYVFPRQCAFPHKAGVAASVSPHEFGDYAATSGEMLLHAMDKDNATVGPVNKEGAEWMSQWSPEEELVAEHSASSMDLFAPWERRNGAARILSIVSFLGVVAVLLKVLRSGVSNIGRDTSRESCMWSEKQHYV